MKLRYSKPASSWNEALPIGCGRLGAMIYGTAPEMRLQINEESVWSGRYNPDADNPECAPRLPEMRRLFFSGNMAEGEEMAAKYLICRGPGSHFGDTDEHRYGSFETAGELYCRLSHGEEIAGYLRTLSLTTGVAETVYTSGGVSYRRRAVSSLRRAVTSELIEADAPFDAKLRFERRDVTVEYADDEITVRGSFRKGLAYATVVRVTCEGGGEVLAEENCLLVRGTTALRITLDTHTSYFPPEPDETGSPSRDTEPLVEECRRNIDSALTHTFLEIIEESASILASFMNRVTLDLACDDSLESLPTDERIERVRAGERDAGLLVLYFAFGRYLLVSSSYNCRLPANLQGVWSEDYISPWNADYHININTQMNYWPAEVCGLSELTEPFLRYIRFLSRHGSRTARIQYGCGGWCAHTSTNPWGFTSPGEGVDWGSFMCAGAWCCLHIWERYRFSGDVGVLSEYFDVLEGAARFFLDFLVEDPNNGYLVTCPSNSPENWFYDPKTHRPASICAGPTMDGEIVRETFHIVSEACRLTSMKPELGEAVRAAAARLKPLSLGRFGQIMEWNEDYEEVEPNHRHISHLFALFPAEQISEDTPELLEGARVVLRRRLESGGGHTGWSRAWIINFYARLGEGDECLRHLYDLAGRCTLPNMFDNHPPFQIDGNFGGVSGIAEMLIASHTGRIVLLPALPEEDPDFASGRVTGLRARGGFTVSVTWEDHRVTSFMLENPRGGDAVVRYNGIEATFTTVPGETLHVSV